MQIKKRLLCPERLRKTPPQFSWVDQRLVRQGHLRRCDPAAWALYLALVVVADAQGLSYYSDGSLARILAMDPVQLSGARARLCQAGFVAWQAPLYQVLSLEPAVAEDPRPPRVGGVRGVGEILAAVLEKGGGR